MDPIPSNILEAWTQFKKLFEPNLANPPQEAADVQLDIWQAIWQLAESVGALPDGKFSGPQRTEFARLIGDQVEKLVNSLATLIAEMTEKHLTELKEILNGAKELLIVSQLSAAPVAVKERAKSLVGEVDSLSPATPLGERLATIRKDLLTLLTAATKDSAKLPELQKAYTNLGGLVLAAVLETKPDSEPSVDSARSGFHARFLYDPSRDDDLAGLLLNPSIITPRTELWSKMQAPGCKELMTIVIEAFAKQYGGFENLQARNALLKAGVPAATLQPMWNRAKTDVESRGSVAKLRLHGATKLPRVVDFTSTLARELAMGSVDKALTFKSNGISGDTLLIPELGRKVDGPLSFAVATQVADELGLKPNIPPKVYANGRTLRFEQSDNSIVALKFMKTQEKEEEPRKLHHEQESFQLLKNALGDEYPAAPFPFATKGGPSCVFKLQKKDLPPDALEILGKELKLKHMTLAEEAECYFCFSYRVAISSDVPGDRISLEESMGYFDYLEDTPDDNKFKLGFRASMVCLGRMAAKGFFNPSLIANSYHDPKAERPWVWSPNLFVPQADAAGKEERPLANAQYSNFRVAGLADPDEFRHISQVLETEFEKMVGKSGRGNAIIENINADEKAKTKLIVTFLIGRMIHEALVIATRRLVLQGAFEPVTDKQRRNELYATFTDAVREGVLAFAVACTGRTAAALTEALAASGLRLDGAIKGLLTERRALYSFEVADKIRERDANYFSQLFGTNANIIEFKAASLEDLARDKEILDMPSLSVILQAADKIAAQKNAAEALKETVATLKKTSPPGWVTVLGVDANSKPVHLEDLGWMVKVDKEVEKTIKGPNGTVTIETPEDGKSGPTVVRVQATTAEEFRTYMDGLKARVHDLQNVGERNGPYFFQNEMHFNMILSSTLVGLLVG
ncbi:hypothetical protein F4679DRAFT_597674 [Xylaria curta]|nr:hypothetical protein F4679DRAFT_597674 [Xylaria curta]